MKKKKKNDELTEEEEELAKEYAEEVGIDLDE